MKIAMLIMVSFLAIALGSPGAEPTNSGLLEPKVPRTETPTATATSSKTTSTPKQSPTANPASKAAPTQPAQTKNLPPIGVPPIPIVTPNPKPTPPPTPTTKRPAALKVTPPPNVTPKPNAPPSTNATQSASGKKEKHDDEKINNICKLLGALASAAASILSARFGKKKEQAKEGGGFWLGISVVCAIITGLLVFTWVFLPQALRGYLIRGGDNEADYRKPALSSSYEKRLSSMETQLESLRGQLQAQQRNIEKTNLTIRKLESAATSNPASLIVKIEEIKDSIGKLQMELQTVKAKVNTPEAAQPPTRLLPTETPLPEIQTYSSCESRAVVTAAYREVPQDGGPPKKARDLQLRDTITVEIAGLSDFLRCAGGTGKSGDIVLYLNDRPLSDVTALPTADLTSNILRFPLRRSEASREAWTYVLGGSKWSPHKIRVSIGFNEKSALPTRDLNPLLLYTIPHQYFPLRLLLLILLLIGFVTLASRTELIRDRVTSSARRPYSLARTQAAWWLFLIFAAYLHIGMTTGDTSLTGTVLALLGISAGTVMGAALIDANKNQSLAIKPRKIIAQQRLTEDFDRRIQPNSNAITVREATAQSDERVPGLDKSNNNSESFLQDILCDTNGVSFHRFQLFTWTFVLGIIFILAVWKDIAMPDFSNTLLSLMGLSSGIYLFIKITEETSARRENYSDLDRVGEPGPQAN